MWLGALTCFPQPRVMWVETPKLLLHVSMPPKCMCVFQSVRSHFSCSVGTLTWRLSVRALNNSSYQTSDFQEEGDWMCFASVCPKSCAHAAFTAPAAPVQHVLLYHGLPFPLYSPLYPVTTKYVWAPTLYLDASMERGWPHSFSAAVLAAPHAETHA